MTSFARRWVRGQTAWNAPLCFAAAVGGAATALLCAGNPALHRIAAFNIALSLVNLVLAEIYRRSYRRWRDDDKR